MDAFNLFNHGNYQVYVLNEIAALPSEQFDAVLHDPPRFGIAGEGDPL